MDSEIRPFIIISAGRSGSSYTAKQFADAGVWCGKYTPGDHNNPDGYYENNAIKLALTRIHGRDWLGPFPEERSGFSGVVRQVLDSEGYRDGPWLFKCGAFYWKCFKSFNPVYVKAWRQPEKIMLSYQRIGWLAQKYTDEEIETIIRRQHDAMKEIPGLDCHI
jgi:hypothetical protein